RFGGALRTYESRSKRAAGADTELAIDAREVGLDRADAHEECRGDFLVRAALDGEVGDALLCLGEPFRAWGPAANPPELRTGLGAQDRGPEPLEDGKRLLEHVARGPLLLSAPQRRAEAEQRTPTLERKGDAVELGERPLER